jgi:hypothetical protein
MRRSLSELQDVSVTGKFLKKQLVKLDKQTHRRKAPGYGQWWAI